MTVTSGRGPVIEVAEPSINCERTAMTESRRCPQCGALRPAAAPPGICPDCVFRMGQQATFISGEFAPPAPADLEPLFPQLEILELLGKGGMGAVYKARQPTLDRLVALKILPPEIGHDPAFAERFTREARALARLAPPPILAGHDFWPGPPPLPPPIP